MRNVVIGTAGHVDHGKTALVRKLTGIDTDRLPEEKSRGMSIDIGIAAHTLPSGRTIDLVDVPGHERFIHNMLRGVAGIDAAMLVVAADDGPMPQTEEHLDVLSLLGVLRGLVVVSKVDLVDEELLQLALEETREALAGSCLEEAPLVCVSAKTGEGIDEINQALEKLCGRVAPRDEDSAFRLPVDRVFSVPGAGTVVTGTIAAGTISADDSVQLYPDETVVTLRGLQCRGQAVDQATAGDRVGLSLRGVDAKAVERGTVVAAPGSLKVTHLVNARITYSPRNVMPLRSRQRVHLFTGTGDAIGRAVLMDREVLLPGESGLAQLRLERKLAPAPMDAFVLRSLSPSATIGGGIVLEAASRRYRAHHPASLATRELLAAIDGGGLVEAATKALAEGGMLGCTVPGVAQQLGLTQDAAARLLGLLVQQGAACQPAPGLFVKAADFAELKNRICAAVDRHHRSRPLEASVPSEAIRARLDRRIPRQAWSHALAELSCDGRLRVEGSRLAAPGYVPRPSPKQLETIELIRCCFSEAGLQPLWPGDICAAVTTRTPSQVKLMLDFMIVQGDLVKLKAGAVLTASQITQATDAVSRRIASQGHITLPEARDLLGVGRHPAQAILEYLDSVGITRREGDRRVFAETREAATAAFGRGTH